LCSKRSSGSTRSAQFHRDFAQVSDGEVVALLSDAERRDGTRRGEASVAL
jgi:predicted phosphoribosyltransferase